MKLFLLIFFNLLLLSGASGQTINLEKEVPLPAESNLSLIEHVHVSAIGDVLVTDSSRRNVILFIKETGVFLQLNPDDCHPGYSFQPVRSYFVDDKVWVMNQQSRIFRFKKDGSCIGADSERFPVPDHFNVTDSNRVAAIKPIGNDLRNPGLTLYNFSLEEVSNLISFQDRTIAPEMGFRYGGGGLFSHEGTLYFSLSSAPIIYSYAIKSKNLMTFSPDEAFDMSISSGEDLNGNQKGNPAGIFSEIRDYTRSYTTTIDFGKLNETTAVLYVQQPDRSNRELLFFDLESNTFEPESYVIEANSEEHFHAFSNSKAYSITFQDDANGWVLQVYDIDY